jgi:hypothetical protein
VRVEPLSCIQRLAAFVQVLAQESATCLNNNSHNVQNNKLFINTLTNRTPLPGTTASCNV